MLSLNGESTPTQLRWSPFDIPKEDEDFVQGLKTVSFSGEPSTGNGLAIHIYTANQDMNHKAFYNSDGDFLIGKVYMKSKRKEKKRRRDVEKRSELPFRVHITLH